jgi:hypothetical protein
MKVSTYGYRWFDGNNTYHSVIVFIDGEEIFRSKVMEHGYGYHYEHTGFREFLKFTNQGKPSDYGPVAPRRWYEEHGIDYETNVFDVKRKKDLFLFAPFGN